MSPVLEPAQPDPEMARAPPRRAPTPLPEPSDGTIIRKKPPPPRCPLPERFDGCARFFLVAQEPRVRRFRVWRYLVRTSPERYRIRLQLSSYRGAWFWLEERLSPADWRAARRRRFDAEPWRPVESLEPWEGPTKGPWTRPPRGTPKALPAEPAALDGRFPAAEGRDQAPPSPEGL